MSATHCVNVIPNKCNRIEAIIHFEYKLELYAPLSPSQPLFECYVKEIIYSWISRNLSYLEISIHNMSFTQIIDELTFDSYK